MIKIIIPNYIRQVKLSEKQRAIYYKYDKDTHTVSCSKKILLKYLKSSTLNLIDNRKRINFEYFNTGLSIDKVGKHDVVFDMDDKPIIANTTKVGKPRYEIISGQSIYSSNTQQFQRLKVMEAIKYSFLPYIKDIAAFDAELYPIRVKLYIYDTVKNMFDKTKDPDKPGIRWDLNNRAYPYSKAILDILTTGMIGSNCVIPNPPLIDDDRLHVTEDGGAIFCPIDNTEDRKLVFILFKDTYKSLIAATESIEKEREILIRNNKHYRYLINDIKIHLNIVDYDNDSAPF